MPKAMFRGFTAVAFSLWCGVAFADILEGIVVGVRDGDTVVVLDKDKTQYVVRLSGIDAPEKAQPYGERARQQLASFVFKEPVVVEWKKRDRYKRIVGKVLRELPKSVCVASDCQPMQDAGLMMITVGLSWHYKQYEREQSATDREQYTQAENIAQSAKRGLWGESKPVPPWSWRKKK